MASPYIVVVGSCDMDLISYTDELPKAGETVIGNSFSDGCGGKGANQCVAASRLGCQAYMVAKVGDDSFGEQFISAFKDNNVKTDFVKVMSDTTTGVATIIVDQHGENVIVVVGGANDQMAEQDVKDAENIISNATLVICQGEITESATRKALQIAKSAKVMTIMNAAPTTTSMDPAIYSLSDIFCVNETEAEILTGLQVKTIDDAEKAAENLLSRNCKEVIITLGSEGALLSDRNGHSHIATPKVTPIDTTGAGDTFIGALAYFLCNHQHLTRAEMISRACRVASFSVQRKGTQSSMPLPSDLPADIFQ